MFKHKIWNSENFLFILLLGLILLSSSFNVSFIYGISFTFTSIFLFLMLRLFGLPHAVIAGLLAFLLIPHHFSHVTQHALLIVEVLFVGAFFLNGRKAKMFFVDILFWMTIGFVGLLLINQTYLIGNALYFQIGKTVVNGLFNVLIADMLLAYVPFYKFFKNNKISRNNVSIHQFLSHITFISIILPFFFSVMTNVWNTKESLDQDNIFAVKHSVSLIQKEMLNWKTEDLLTNKVSDLVSHYQANDFDVVISDLDNLVYGSSTTNIPTRTVNNWNDYDVLNTSATDFKVILPKGDEGYPIRKWSGGYYLFSDDIKPLSMKVMFLIPISQYQNQLYNIFLEQLGYSVIFAIFIIMFVQTVSRIFMTNIRQLTLATTHLPQKLVQNETIEWPQGHVSELRLLSKNLREMAEKLAELFRESNSMNSKLKEQTEQLIESEFRLNRLAFYDVLTGLPNRRHFQDYVQSLIYNQTSSQFAVIFIDINQFKQVNDTIGHMAGDTLLQLVADHLRTLNNDRRQIFRLSGDEFVIVFSIEMKEEIHEMLKQLQDEFSAPFSIQGHLLYVTASIGISVYPEDGKDIDSLLKCADIAMYQSKEKGGNVAHFFNESMRNKYDNRLLIENSLRLAVDRGDFVLYYQPKYRLGKITSMEALIRWIDPELGFVSPGSFIPIAEEIGLILKIDRWSLIEACKQNKEWQDRGFPKVPISVNISAKQFQQDSLVSMVKEALDISGIDPKYIKLEITESVFIKNLDHVASIIKQLKDIGVKISIDDFGKGYSSLYPLLQLPIDEIKIDRQFISDIDQNMKKSRLVQSILSMAKGLQLNVVAEGIETNGEKNTLLQMGCDELQGYLFSRPINAQEIESLLLNKK
ncbi:putative bifunctional diguanylate cyclase/phosphodiesterase [Lederbergia wuyishanensis]|uniref:Diguanylate cyclase (GGDEF)-like protein n=1 Tax=Lederbergia wuyishanensis TaxID=1347903 RepID=A0ABU0D478_9BACI|nr:EAL domain-containing protein [Lederbergia wuyishanensis]MCJ8008201.1 EAL domain-containing protein [Lederbergia wuyishanensis]MDQ0343210.1 diguanylate cyclase (GGDEF)-like protein [Lederbergia wuyishanensis]